MPAALRKITAEDVTPLAQFAAERKDRRAALLPTKRLRRIALGPHCTFYFESFETLLFQVEEMLLVEKGGAEQLVDELAAYNPLVPQGAELVATIMFEIDDPIRRETVLNQLGGVEDDFFIQFGAEKSKGVSEDDVERTREDGKTSSVHFLHFPVTPEQKAVLRDPTVQIMIGCDHPLYAHMAALSPATRAELAKDLA
jgi:hypothetical protein